MCEDVRGEVRHTEGLLHSIIAFAFLSCRSCTKVLLAKLSLNPSATSCLPLQQLIWATAPAISTLPAPPFSHALLQHPSPLALPERELHFFFFTFSWDFYGAAESTVCAVNFTTR